MLACGAPFATSQSCLPQQDVHHKKTQALLAKFDTCCATHQRWSETPTKLIAQTLYYERCPPSRHGGLTKLNRAAKIVLCNACSTWCKKVHAACYHPCRTNFTNYSRYDPNPQRQPRLLQRCVGLQEPHATWAQSSWHITLTLLTHKCIRNS